MFHQNTKGSLYAAGRLKTTAFPVYGWRMPIVHVRWLPLALLGDETKGTTLALVMLCADRRLLLEAWATIMRAEVLPPEFPSGELRDLPQLGTAVIFEPRAVSPHQLAPGRWPDLTQRVEAIVRSRSAS